MRKITIDTAGASPEWETLETFACVRVQEFVQRLLEEEVDELLGCKKSERRGADAFRWDVTARQTLDVFAAGCGMTFPRDGHLEAR